MTSRTTQLALSQQTRIILPHQLLALPIECLRVNLMPRQQVMFPCLGIQEIRLGGLSESECAGGWAAEDDEICEVCLMGRGLG